MAQTPAQLLAATKAQLAKSKARLKALEDEQAILKASKDFLLGHPFICSKLRTGSYGIIRFSKRQALVHGPTAI
jgi:hypothetical protein